IYFDQPTERAVAAVPALDRVLADIEPVYLEHGDALRLRAGVGGWGLGGEGPNAPAQPPTLNPQPPTRGWPNLLPMALRGQVHRALYVADTRPERVFAGLETAICSPIAAQAATAIENARLYQEEVRTREEIASLRDYNQAILDNLNTGVFVIDA